MRDKQLRIFRLEGLSRKPPMRMAVCPAWAVAKHFRKKRVVAKEMRVGKSSETVTLWVNGVISENCSSNGMGCWV